MTDRPMHPATAEILRFFEYKHLPPNLADISMPFHDLAHHLAHRLDGPELTAGLRKLLEAKDCAVRAALPKPAPEPQYVVDGQPVDRESYEAWADEGRATADVDYDEHDVDDEEGGPF